ncbi:MAG: type II toxin-antitoxin system VapC family toxin [Chthoniobacteraceae bacterium]|nr:type II toxin-antitoxin system VapC family toxin [Chthoniobacteraceae bacterium]
MRFLVDANVLSEITRPSPAPQVLDWLATNEAELAVNPVILGEIEYGILLLEVGVRRNRLLEWFRVGVQKIHVFDFDAATASTWAQLLAQLRGNGKSMPVKDSMIAASALTHKLTVVTRNIRDFEPCGVKILDPFL